MRSRRFRVGWSLGCAVTVLSLLAATATAQTDYYNTDLGRPVRIEDASPVERYAFELQLAPLRLERSSGGEYAWEIEPEVAYGVLPRTQLEVGFPFAYLDGPGGGESSGLAGIDIAALHNLNVETGTLPALAVAASLSLPVGPLASDRTYGSVKGIATRTFRIARVHANAEYTFGEASGAEEDAGEHSRWMAGFAVDRAFPLKSFLAIADVFVEQPFDSEDSIQWTAETGIRYQTSPQFNIDFGLGRRFAGDHQGWFFTFGLAHAFAVRSLMPGR